MVRYKKYLSTYVSIPRSTILMRKWREQQRGKRNEDKNLFNLNEQEKHMDERPPAPKTSTESADGQPANLEETAQGSIEEENVLIAEGEVVASNEGVTATEVSLHRQILNPDGTGTVCVAEEASVLHVYEEGLNPNGIDAACASEEVDKETAEKLMPLCSHTTSTADDVMVMALALGVRHNLTYVAVVDILKLINAIFGDNTIKASKFSLFKRMGIPDKLKDLEYHMFCDICCIHVQKSKNDTEVNCSGCNKSLSIGESTTYFGCISFESQLKQLLSNNLVAEMILNHRFSRSKSNPNNLEDIYDGSEYSRLSAPGEVLSHPENFSYSFFIDGVPLGNTKKSLWPIYVTINELPPLHRRNHLILVGLYYGSKDPNQTYFLKPFVDEANKLSREGFKWSYNGSDVHSKVIPLVAVADSVARCKLVNMQTFSSYYGCTFCYQKTEHTIKRRKFVIPLQAAEQRNAESYEYDMKKVFDRRYETREEKRSYRGVKGPACLKSLDHFNFFAGFVVDYMHNMLLGVCKLYFELSFDSRRRNMWNLLRENEQFAMEDLMVVIDERLLSIKPPSLISRTPRTIKSYEHWKANEWRSWLLYYSIPCLKGLMKKKHFRHFAMLSVAFQLLMQKSVSTEDVSEAHRLLILFSNLFEKYYGPENMVYNIHLLQHVSQGVLHWGPLWTHNAFMYEAFNRILLGLAKNPNSVVKEVLQKYLILRDLPRIVTTFVSSDLVLDFCEDLLEHRLVHHSQCGSCILLDAPKPYQHLAPDHIQALRHLNINVETCLYYDRMLYNGMRISSSQYSEKNKQCNSVIYTTCMVCEVLSIVRTSLNVNMLLVQEILPHSKLVLNHDTVSVTHIQRVESYGSIRLLSPELVMGLCVLAENRKGTFLSKVALAVNGD